jgi:ABC-type polysaccharide/polyol phosphate transport system ATPase subunit
MDELAVDLQGVGKRYLLGEDHGGYRTLGETLAATADRLRHRRVKQPPEELWSLRDIDVQLAEGEALGIIGRNGAGKSTLLKVLTRITEPTEGVSRTRGRVGALLEVGTGFHPELTGRENVYLNGAIHGMSQRDVARRFDEIVDFSGVERFLDTPIKRYSSGMYLRLAFAVAAHLEPDILVVDEILAVGDAEFQRKCLGRMEQAESQGRTVIFVSHSLETVVRLCPRALWLDAGRVIQDGPAHEVVDAYLAAGMQRVAERTFEEPPDAPVWLATCGTHGGAGQAATLSMLRRDEPVTVELEINVRERVPGLNLAVSVTNLRGTRVLDEAWSETAAYTELSPGRYALRLVVPPVLPIGEYAVGVWIGSAYQTLLWEPEAAVFRLEGDVDNRPDRLVQLDLPWEVRALDQPGLLD